MSEKEIPTKKYLDVLKEQQKVTFVLGKRFFLGEFRYFVVTLLATFFVTILIIIFSTIPVSLKDSKSWNSDCDIHSSDNKRGIHVSNVLQRARHNTRKRRLRR